MTKPLTDSRRGAVATGASAAGATATGAGSLGAMAIGAAAIGAIAVGALAIGRLTIGRTRLRRVEIGQLAVAELAVGRLDVGVVGKPGDLTAVTRIRALPGKGDAFEQFLLDRSAASEPGMPFRQAHRSRSDPDLFAIHEACADEAAVARNAQAQSLAALLSQAADQGLVAIAEGDPVEVELYRAI